LGERIRFSPGMRDSHEELLPQFVRLLEAAAGRESWCLDIGCGDGRVALALAPRVRWVVGIDRKPERILAARSRAESKKYENARFLVADAEVGGYSNLSPPGRFDLITSNLCLTDSIVRHAAEALAPGCSLVVTCFAVEHWRETRVQIDHSYTEGRLWALLRAAGLGIEQLDTITRVVEFDCLEQLVVNYLPERVVKHWRENGRFRAIEESFNEGAGTLTDSRIVFCARKPGL
jgi:SAM-dependent methyltransferase